MKQRELLRFIGSVIAIPSVVFFVPASTVLANPYLPKSGEAPIRARVGTCSITGSIIHLSTALDNGIFEKYGLRMEHIAFRGSGVTLAALGADEIQFLTCAASATLPGLSTGVEAKYIGSQLVGLPWFMLGRKEIRSPLDLKGRALGITRVGDLTHRLALEVLKKFNLSPQDVKLQPVGGSGQLEPYNAMAAGVVHAVLVSPPLEVRGKKDGFNIVYNLKDLGIPFVYSSLHANTKTIATRPLAVQRYVAAMAETLHFTEMNPVKAKASLSKALKLNDPDALQSAYGAFAKTIANRRLVVPMTPIEEMIDQAREAGTQTRRKAADIVDNRFAEDLAKSGFLTELWGKDRPK
jgi:ABC-type nitrate/sulfonate/bicarbonate transport system substrate-binding protein